MSLGYSGAGHLCSARSSGLFCWVVFQGREQCLLWAGVLVFSVSPHPSASHPLIVFQEKIIHALDVACSMLPESVSDVCQEVVDTYSGYIVSILEAEMNPEQVCRELHLCASGKGQTGQIGRLGLPELPPLPKSPVLPKLPALPKSPALPGELRAHEAEDGPS